MPNLAAGDVVRVLYQCRNASQIGLNVRFYRVGSVTLAGITEAEAAATLDANAQAGYKNIMSVNSSYHGVSVQRVFPNTTPTIGVAIGNDGIGAVASDVLPWQVCGAVTLITGLAGRSNRGRMYLPFPYEDASSATGKPTGAYKTSVVPLASFMTLPVTVAGAGGTAVLTPGLWNRTTTTFKDFAGYNIRDYWTTQRRRGENRRADTPPF